MAVAVGRQWLRQSFYTMDGYMMSMVSPSWLSAGYACAVDTICVVCRTAGNLALACGGRHVLLLLMAPQLVAAAQMVGPNHGHQGSNLAASC